MLHVVQVGNPNVGWYINLVRKDDESEELLMIYRFMKFNKTMIEVYRHAKVDCS
jgi:hypothetical protein